MLRGCFLEFAVIANNTGVGLHLKNIINGGDVNRSLSHRMRMEDETAQNQSILSSL